MRTLLSKQSLWVALALLSASPVLASVSSVADGIDPSSRDSHRQYAAALRRHQIESPDEVLRLYDAARGKAPGDPVPMIERCAFLGTPVVRRRMNDRTGVERRACVDQLEVLFPQDPDARVHVIQFWHYSVPRARAFLADPPPGTQDPHLAAVHAYLAKVQPVRLARVRNHGEKAMALDPSWDLRLIVAHAWRIKDKAKAREVLLTNLEQTPSWERGKKASLLVELGEYQHSLAVFRQLEEEQIVETFLLDYAEALAANGLIEEARARYASAGDADAEIRQLRARLEFELAHGDTENARAAYDRLVENDWMEDMFAYYRIALLKAHPGAEWKLSDGAGFVASGAVAALGAILPVVFVAPVLVAGRVRHWLGRPPPAPPVFRSSLKRAWLAVSASLIASILPFAVWPDAMTDQNAATSDHVATFVWGSLLSFVAIFWIARREAGSMLSSGRWRAWRTIGAGALLFVLILLSAQLALALFGEDPADPLVEMVQFMSRTDGWPYALFYVALVVPLYEEVLYRGIVLSAFQTRLSFGGANLLQAAAFAVVHVQPVVMFSAFTIGMASGWMVHRSASLRASILGHVLTNAYWTFIVTFEL